MKISAILLVMVVSATAHAYEGPRYFYSGDGRLAIHSNLNGTNFSGTYRKPDGTYDVAALKAINRTFAATFGNPATEISPRLIEFLDYLEDRTNPGAKMTIASGYRSPTYNAGLRQKGKLAAKASLHQYGMATDLRIAGVDPERLWNMIRELGFGGAGFYHGANVHVDVGPARFWDEATSGVDTDISDDNKLIGIVADKDIYAAGETARVRFIRMTLFPVEVAGRFVLEKKDEGGAWKKVSEADVMPYHSQAGCASFSDIASMSNFQFAIPQNAQTGRYRIKTHFCGELPSGMPPEVETPEFEVRR